MKRRKAARSCTGAIKSKAQPSTLRDLHGAVGAYNFIAFAIPGVDLLLIIEFNDLAKLMNVLRATIDFEAPHTSCIRLRGGENEFLI